MRTYTILTSVVLLTLAGCGQPTATTPSAQPAEVAATALGELARVHLVGDLYVAGQPSQADLEAASAMGVKTVVSYRKPGESVGFDEAKVVADLGMTFVAEPWKAPAELTDDALAGMRKTLGSASRPMLVHCGSANRAGAVWAAYRALDEGVAIDTAIKEAKQIGLSSEAFEARIREYVASQTK